jgi:hypothetical protein
VSEISSSKATSTWGGTGRISALSRLFRTLRCDIIIINAILFRSIYLCEKSGALASKGVNWYVQNREKQ